MIIHHQAGNWGVQSTPTSKIYLISWLKGLNRWGCTCPDFQHRRAASGQNCKHIKALRCFLDLADMKELEELRKNEIITV